MNEPYQIIEPNKPIVPIVVSVPHCGTEFPSELESNYKEEFRKQPDDTDWFVHQLYNFASELGITIIHAKYSRWVIDLNRDPESAPLYNDGRIITGLTPSTDFFGNDIYTDTSFIPDVNEVNRRLKNYYWPYYQKIQDLLDERKKQFGKVLLWDAHSIRQFVPTIRKENFPDMILGNNDEKTAPANLISVALENFKNGKFQINHNTPFKGGHITRYFGKPEQNQYTLQLEMVKKLYMEDDELTFSEGRANEVRMVLRSVFESLLKELT